MKRYYKVVTDYSCFCKVYNIADAAAIPGGTKFIGKDICGQHQETSLALDSDVLHFSDNIFDTMLWYEMLVGGLCPNAQIYEVRPLTPVQKKRVAGGIGAFQCGANMIEFVKPVNVAHMFKSAVAEFHHNPKSKIQMYPNLDVAKVITAWAKKERSKLVY